MTKEKTWDDCKTAAGISLSARTSPRERTILGIPHAPADYFFFCVHYLLRPRLDQKLFMKNYNKRNKKLITQFVCKLRDERFEPN
jgi:hypothetical protein